MENRKGLRQVALYLMFVYLRSIVSVEAGKASRHFIEHQVLAYCLQRIFFY